MAALTVLLDHLFPPQHVHPRVGNGGNEFGLVKLSPSFPNYTVTILYSFLIPHASLSEATSPYL